ncbi:carbon-nitrogen hydrolase family protein [Sneathiella aquimaris]|uniref:carbon-nitrogen hydrolase family protein n=1 Tax=Sneathiella aquimaris TaxID=2599305 RepID=UPI00146C6FB2|nr:carbon-nitrogen hydrolase family protein [Sneathiella aquimaris]
MRSFAIAGLQLNLETADNIDLISRKIDSVMRRFPWVQMVIIGELAGFGPRPSTAETMPGPTENHFGSIAKKHNIWLLPGSLYEQSGGKVYNTTPVLNPDGEVVTRHRKLYPFLPYEQGIEYGEQITVFDIPDVGRFGVSICYDMWFPETTRAMVSAGAEVILHPTMTNTSDREVETVIARASAVQNQCYFVDINSVGEIGYGRSSVIGPQGEVIYQAGCGEEIVTAELDLEQVRRVRERGIMGLGQTLKSFRDAPIKYVVYENGLHGREGLSKLGNLEVPGRI